MSKKQVVFRLDEELHRRLQMYALQQDKTIQDLMEGLIEQILRGGHALPPRLLKIIQDKIINCEAEIKEVLKRAYKNSLRLDSSDEDTVIQIIINGQGEIREREAQRGLLPNSVMDSKSYILYEFPCRDVLTVYYREQLYNESDFYEPLEGRYKEFAEWLKKHELIDGEEYDEDDYFHIVYDIYRKESFKENGGIEYSSYLELVYRWSPEIFYKIKTNIRDMVYYEEDIEKAWQEISQREELGF